MAIAVMSMDGKTIRMSRILHSGKAVIVPMDHGVSDGPIEGLEDIGAAVRLAGRGGASAVILHKGAIKSLKTPPGCGIIMHVSAGTKYAEDKNRKVLVSGLRQAIRLGADAVSVHVNIGGSPGEADMLSELGEIGDECDSEGMPLLVMAYARGKNVTSSPDEIAHAARIGGELGADLVKCPYTGDINTMGRVVRSCPSPIVIAGGPKCESEGDVLRMVEESMAAGAIGISLGRNIFQSARPDWMTSALKLIIVDGYKASDAMPVLRGLGVSAIGSRKAASPATAR